MPTSLTRPLLMCIALMPCAIWSPPCVMATTIDWPQLSFTQIASGASTPTSIADAGDGSGRLFITDQSGRVLLVQSNGVVPFLDISNRVEYAAGTELGLLSVAFPPGFATKQYFYVFYNRQLDSASTISRFFVSSTNANVADPTTEQTVLAVPIDPEACYTLSGGLLIFGPDGFLYAALGDSGFCIGSTNQAQNTERFEGKILRIDVESSTNAYQVPLDNPFVGNTNYLPEIWALGVRNPWRFSFDRANGDFYMGDVGQIESEEVNFKPAATTAGQNYGWPIREGLHLYAGPDPAGIPLTDPILEYLHTGPPASITGGFVYRGPGPNRMTGIYFYADAYSGKIWGLKQDGTNWLNQQLARQPYFITAFGEDESGQLYVADYISGKIYRMDDSGAAVAPTFYPPGTNSFTDTITLSSLSSNVVIRYTLNGVDPVATDPGISSGGTVSISSGATLKARAFRNDLLPSSVASVTYNLKVARPFFNPPVGPATNGQLITLLCATPGATICFTLDGTDPTAGSPVYSSPVAFTNGVPLKAAGFKAGFAASTAAAFVPSSVVIQNYSHGNSDLNNLFSCLSQPGWTYQMQVGEDPLHWRNFGGTQAGTNGLLTFKDNNVPPAPLRHMFRIKAVEDSGL
jgi:glucose/arabinose dehydrogenase